MGITFRPASTPQSEVVLDYRIHCGAQDGPSDSRRFSTYQHAQAALAHHAQLCPDLWCWPDTASIVARTVGDDDPVVDVSSSNGALLLRALDLAGELGGEDVVGGACSGTQFPWSGELVADELIERILLARALRPADSGLPAHALDDTGRFIHCGRRPGYLDQRLAELENLARYAVAGHRHVVWH